MFDHLRVEIKTVNEAYEACAKLRQMGFVWDELNEEWAEAERALLDAIVYGTSVMQGGTRVDPTSIYAEPQPVVTDEMVERAMKVWREAPLRLGAYEQDVMRAALVAALGGKHD